MLSGSDQSNEKPFSCFPHTPQHNKQINTDFPASPLRGVGAGVGVNSLDSSIHCISNATLGPCGEIKLSRTVGCLQCVYNKCILQSVTHYSRIKSQPKKTLKLRGHLVTSNICPVTRRIRDVHRQHHWTCHSGQAVACLLQSFKGRSLGGLPWCQLPDRSPSPAAEGQLPAPGALLSSSALVTYLSCLKEWKVLCIFF